MKLFSKTTQNQQKKVRITSKLEIQMLMKTQFDSFLKMSLLWLTHVILATQEAEIRRIMVQSQLEANK
jgi:hypothetical protein